jgi:hypothetical protein
MNPRTSFDDEENEVVFIDETNSVVTGRGPATEAVRKAIHDRLEKNKRLLELKEKMYGKPEEGQKGQEAEGRAENKP